MSHIAEKIPAKEGCQSKRVSKKQQSYPSRVFKQAPLGTTSTAQRSLEVPRVAQQGLHSQNLLEQSLEIVVGFEIFEIAQKQKSYLSRVSKQAFLGGHCMGQRVLRGTQRVHQGLSWLKGIRCIDQTQLCALNF